jgi:hypothetical protein
MASAYYKANLSLIYKRKVADGPMLTQEFHKSVFLAEQRQLAIPTKLGVICKLKISYNNYSDTYGPSDRLWVSLSITNQALGKVLFAKEKIPFVIGKQRSFNFTSKRGDELTLSLKPEILR